MFKNTQDFNTMKLKIKNKRFNITKLWSINNSFSSNVANVRSNIINSINNFYLLNRTIF